MAVTFVVVDWWLFLSLLAPFKHGLSAGKTPKDMASSCNLCFNPIKTSAKIPLMLCSKTLNILPLSSVQATSHVTTIRTGCMLDVTL